MARKYMIGRLPRAEGLNLIMVMHPRYGEAMWSTGKCRKEHQCKTCKRAIAKRDQAYRPVNQSCMYRYERLCVQCVERSMWNAYHCDLCGDLQMTTSHRVPDCMCDPPDFHQRVIVTPCDDEDCQSGHHHWGHRCHIQEFSGGE